MGIINVTPDSFYDGGKTTTISDILAKAELMLSEGASFLDIGGYSSRPGADSVLEEDEIKRVLPAIEAIRKNFPKAIISIDTFRSTIAKKAVNVGANMVNDISGGDLDSKMLASVAKMQVPYILMHMRGNPQTMTQFTDYTAITIELLSYFSEKIALARKAGINDIIIDPGFGFAKTRQLNFELLNSLELLQALDVPILAGISRKSMIYKTLNISPSDSLNGTTALNMVALQKGASIVRVHDVKEAMETITLFQNLKSDS